MGEMNLEITQELKNMIADIYWQKGAGAHGEKRGERIKAQPQSAPLPPLQLSGVGKFPQRRTPDNGDPFTFDYCIILP